MTFAVNARRATGLVGAMLVRGRSFSQSLALLGLLLAGSLLAVGQGVSGRIVGTLTDSTGAVIPNAAVTITNQGTGIATRVTSNANGEYRADNLPPGNYEVRVEAQGLQSVVSKGNAVTVDNATVVNASLKVGAANETVTVSAANVLVDTTSSSLGEVLAEKDVTGLPLNGRVFSQLVQTVPGSIAAGFGSAPEAAAGAGSSGSITASVNGMPWGGTTYTLDGVNNMELLNAFINVTPPLDSIQEIKVSTNNADITVGTYGGSQVNAFIKSGTNAFHGSAYEFFRDDSLNAYQWRAGQKAPYRANQFGGSLGGPILRNKAFFFADYQALLLSNGISYILTVPTDLMKQGTFLKSQFAGPIYDPPTQQPFPTVSTPQGDAWQIPVDRFDPVSRNMVNGATIWPAATDQSSINNNFKANTVEPDHTHQFDVKVDYQISANDRIFARESYQRRDLSAPSPGTRFIQIGDVNAQTRDHNSALRYNHTFSPNMTNELRLGFNRFYTKDFGNDLAQTRTPLWVSPTAMIPISALPASATSVSATSRLPVPRDGPTRTASAIQSKLLTTSPASGARIPSPSVRTTACSPRRSPTPTQTRTGTSATFPTTPAAAPCSPPATIPSGAISSPAFCSGCRRASIGASSPLTPRPPRISPVCTPRISIVSPTTWRSTLPCAGTHHSRLRSPEPAVQLQSGHRSSRLCPRRQPWAQRGYLLRRLLATRRLRVYAIRTQHDV